MNTKSEKPTESYLKSYSAYVDYWDEEAGDTHLLLGFREVLHDRTQGMTPQQLSELSAIDDKVLNLAQQNVEVKGWDAEMLRQTAQLIELERRHAHA